MKKLISKFAALVILASTIVLTRPASADVHFALAKAEPANESVLESPPTSIKLWFTEEPDLAGTRIRLVDHHDEMVSLGPVMVGEDDENMVYALIEGDASHDGFTIMWRGMAADGHILSGEITFEVESSR